MKSRFIQEGGTLDYTNTTSAAIAAGDVVVFGSKVGIAATDIPVGSTGTVKMNGVFEVLKDENEISLGAKVYYDPTNEIVTATSNESTIEAGYAVSTATASSSTVHIKLVG